MSQTEDGAKNEWSTTQHALAYLNVADHLPHRTEGEAVLLDHVVKDVARILDLGTGDGRLIKLLKVDRPNVEAVAIDTSPTMLKSAREHFAKNPDVKIVNHDLSLPLPDFSYFVHHLDHKLKRSLYEEIYNILTPTGVFCNLEHVASPSMELHIRFLNAIGYTPKTESKSDKVLPMETQLDWLREIGFVDVNCYWKWLEMALLIGYKV